MALFERDAATLHRTVSQRIDQHDAHLTALAALVVTGDQAPNAPLNAVSASILQFYPRLVSIDVVALQPGPTLLWSQRRHASDVPVNLIVETAQRASGRTELAVSPQIGGRYILVKRVPSETNLRFVISLEVDGRRLMETESADFTRTALLGINGGDPIHESMQRQPDPSFGTVRLAVQKRLASASQPLWIAVEREVSVFAIMPWAVIAAAALAIGGVLVLLRAILMHRSEAREAMQKAQASAQEARLAHATRINSMGELSLAIAHELAQPLAALLSQSQAGLRMLKSGAPEKAEIAGVLEANARLAKRAGDLLSQLRGWVSAETPALQPVDLNRVINDIGGMNRGDLAQRGIDLKLDLVQHLSPVAADQVSMEQIVQNLIANARDASPRGTTIIMTTFADADDVGFTVTDEGPGIPPEITSRLFEPFVTSKPNGMGLGLSISRRLVEKFGGRMRVDSRGDGRSGAVLVVQFSP